MSNPLHTLREAVDAASLAVEGPSGDDEFAALIDLIAAAQAVLESELK